jgi:hypothetical protein
VPKNRCVPVINGGRFRCLRIIVIVYLFNMFVGPLLF